MNIKLLLASVATLLGVSGVAFAQPIGNPFASLGLDFYGFFLPWIFAFAIVFGLLSKLQLFEKRINGALAFVVAFFVSAVGGPQLAFFFTSLFGGASMFLAGILVIMLFVAMVGGDIRTGKKGIIAVIVVVLIGVVLFLASSSSFLAVQVLGPDMASMIFWVIIIIAAIYFVMGEGEAAHH